MKSLILLYSTNAVIATVSWVLLVLLVFFGLCYIVYRVIKTEKIRKKYSTKMKVGDKVYIPIVGNAVTGSISKIDGDDVYVIIKKNRTDIYPN